MPRKFQGSVGSRQEGTTSRRTCFSSDLEVKSSEEIPQMSLQNHGDITRAFPFSHQLGRGVEFPPSRCHTLGYLRNESPSSDFAAHARHARHAVQAVLPAIRSRRSTQLQQQCRPPSCSLWRLARQFAPGGFPSQLQTRFRRLGTRIKGRRLASSPHTHNPRCVSTSSVATVIPALGHK